jgi:hypothetical protein
MIGVIEKGIEIEIVTEIGIEEEQEVVVDRMTISVEMEVDQDVIILDLQLVIVVTQEIVIDVQIIMLEETVIGSKINIDGKKQFILATYHMIFVGLN